MFTANEDYLKLPGSYLFSTIARKTNAYSAEHPEAQLVRLGIGDVTKPLPPAVIEALHKAVDEQAHAETFRGYAPDLGYEFLRHAIAENDYRARGCEIADDEIFVSDGAKSDSAAIQEIFSRGSRIAVCDPVYPVYVDSNVMAGRTGTYDESTGCWSDVLYMPCVEANNFSPDLPGRGLTPAGTPDMIYICSPNNPTGVAMTKDVLQAWVDYANEVGAVILFDSAYEAYITENNVPHSIFECAGARTCAIELRSFSKNAGFTGLRLGAAVIPKDLKDHNGVAIHGLWARRHGTKYNGAPYIVQRAGEAVYSEAGKAQVKQMVGEYMANAAFIRTSLQEMGYTAYGGVNSPYVWLKTPNGMTSWDFFDLLLSQANVIGTPGSGFGPSGEHFFRLTSFGTVEASRIAMERIRSL